MILYHNDVEFKDYRITYARRYYHGISKGDYIFKLKKRTHKFGDFKSDSWDFIVEKAKMKRYGSSDHYYPAVSTLYRIVAIEHRDPDGKWRFVDPNAFAKVSSN